MKHILGRRALLAFVAGFFSFAEPTRGAEQHFAINIGQTISNGVPEAGAGNIETAGASDVYSFNGRSGDLLFFDELGGNGCVGALRWKLVSPAGATLFDQRLATQDACGSGPDAGTITLNETGSYTITATSTVRETYSFRIVVIESLARAIGLGETVSHTLATPGATDEYTFAGTAGQRVFFDELTGNGCVGSLRWRLIRPNGQTLFDERFAGVDACGSGPDAGIVELPDSGTYSVRVFGQADWVEAYSFRAVPIIDRTTAIELGASITNTLATPGGIDTYTFAGTAGQRVYFDEQSGNGCVGLLRWRLAAPGGEVLFDQRFAATDACGSGPDAGAVVLPGTGTYSLQVFGINDWVEPYHFSVVPILDRTFAITPPAVVTNTLSTAGAVDTYTFNASTGQHLYFDERTGNGCVGGLHWSLTAPDGQVVFDQRFAAVEACGSGPDAGAFTLTQAGRYSLRVYGEHDWVDQYVFGLTPVVDRVRTLALGAVVTDALTSTGGTDTYTFTGTAGQRVYFDERTGNGCVGLLRWQLTRPGGQVVFDERFAAIDACGSGPDAGTVTLPETGTYSLRVFGINDWVEAYTFALVVVVDRTIPITPGDLVNNTLASQGGTDTYTFMGTAGQRIYFNERSGNGCVGALRWKLNAPDGQVLFDQRFAEADTCGSGPDAGTVALPQTGIYSLRVYGINDWVEDYGFQAVPVVDQLAAITPGTIINNSLQSVGGSDVYTFTAVAGQRMYFDERTGNGCGGALWWKLTAPDATVLFNQRFASIDTCGSGPDAGTVILPAAGTYTLRVYGVNDWVEAYSFALWPLADPAVVPVADRLVTAGDSVSLTLHATPSAPIGAPLKFALIEAPTGATLGTNSGAFAWQAPAAASGDFPVRIRVIDALGNSAEVAFLIKVVFAPDLVITRLDVPSEGDTLASFNVTYREANAGTRVATGPWVTRLWLSTDEVLDAADTLLGEFPFNGTLGPGQSIERTLQFRLPERPAGYRVIASTDASGQVVEADENNNVSVSGAIAVAPAYTATVETDTGTALAGTPVALRGEARRRTGGPAAFELVNVHVKVRGTTRILSAITDAAGQFTLTFRPLLTEAGNYTIGAVHPGLADAPAQDTFKLLGMGFDPRDAILRMGSLTTSSVTAHLVNRSEVPLTGLTATLIEPHPPSLTVQFSLPASIAADATVPVEVKVTSTADVGLAATLAVEVTSSEGTRARLAIDVVVTPKQSILAATPAPLTAGMVRSNQTLATFTLRNHGTLPTGPVSVLLPPLSWLSVADSLPLPPLPPQGSREVTLLLQPPGDLPLGVHEGTIIVTDGTAGANLPFRFVALSEALGDLHIEVVDEYTFYAAGAPRVAGATVILRGHGSTDEVARGTADANGKVSFARLVEGPYDLEVRADSHSTFHGTILVRAGVPNEIQPFLSRETVRYEFTVVPTTIEDRAKIVIETVFETFVPIPVVTIEPAQIDVDEIQGDRAEVELKVTNHGLIAAQNFRFNFAGNSRWRLTPLVTELGDVAARSSVTVPLVIERLKPVALQAPALQGAADDCVLGGGGCYTIICGTNVNTTCVPVFFPYPCGGFGGGGFYLPPPTFGGGAAGTYYPPVCECTPINCDPCSAPVALAILDCAIGFLPIPDFAGCAKDAKGLGDALNDCYQSSKTNGPCNVGAGSLAAAQYFVSCAKAFGKELPYIGNILSGIDCYLKISKAIDDCEGGGLGGPGGPGGGKGPMLAGLPSKNHHAAPAFFPGSALVFDEGRRLENIVGMFTVVFGEAAWFHPRQGTNFNVYLARFADVIDPSSPGGLEINAAERAALMGGVLPDEGTPAQVERSVDRWNRTLAYNARGIFLSTEVPAGESREFIALDAYRAAMSAAVEAFDAQEAEGFVGDPLAALGFAIARLKENMGGGGGGVCARVKLQLDQEAVTTREAFQAQFELANETGEPLTGIQVELQITGPDGQRADALFGVLAPELTDIGSISGNGQVAANSTGKATWLMVPGHTAAPSPAAVTYLVGGFFTYTQGTNSVRVPLTPAPISVHPNPRLELTYFHERDVRSDDPFTDAIEPSIPYSLAVMVRNRGFGAARGVRIVSSEPKIVENEKGLLIDFDLIATEVAGQSITPSLTADFGDINPGGIGIGRWLFKSTLQGQFIDYAATLENIGPLKDLPELSTIESVSIHEMIHIVRAEGPGFADDGRPDFLVNDVLDDEFRPDALYLSDGTTNRISVVTAGAIDGAPSASDLEVLLTASTTAGWTYFRLADPAAGNFRLTRVLRADGSEVRMGDNAWTTDRTFIAGGRRPRYENTVHLFDLTAAGTTQYRLLYSTPDPTDTTPPTSGMIRLSAGSRGNIPVQWFGGDNAGGSGLAYFDVFVAVDRGPFVPWLEKTAQLGAVYPGLSGKRYGFYTVAVDYSGNRETAPASAQTETVVDRANLPPVVTAGGAVVVNEGALVEIHNQAHDGDEPPDALVFSLGAGAPTGATIDPLTGTILWTTGEAHGPGAYSLPVIVTDTGTPSLTSTGLVAVTVNEINAAPELSPIPGQTAREGETLRFTVGATDSDLPLNILSFTLGGGAPSGARLDAATGVFTWSPTADEVPSTNEVTVVVTDNGTPPRSSTGSFTLIGRIFSARLDVAAGRTHLKAGQSGSILLHLDSGAEVTNLTFLARYDGTRLAHARITPVSALVQALEAVPTDSGAIAVRVVSAANQPLQGQLDLARLDFDVVSTEGSAVVPVEIGSVEGLRINGRRALEGHGIQGRVIIIGRQPVLEAASGAGTLTLFGHPGARYGLETRDGFGTGTPWTPLLEVMPGGLEHPITLPPRAGGGLLFYRVVELAPAP